MSILLNGYVHDEVLYVSNQDVLISGAESFVFLFFFLVEEV